MASLDSVVQLLQQLTLKVESVQAQLTALQNVPAPKSRSKSSSTTPVGMGGDGQTEKKYPINTLAWIKEQCAITPDFFKQYLNEHYDTLVATHFDELKNEDPKTYPIKLGEKLWKDIKTLCDSKDVATKTSANTVSELVTDLWRKGKLAWQAAHPAAPSAGVPALQALETPVLTQPLLPTMSFQLPSMPPAGVTVLNLKA